MRIPGPLVLQVGLLALTLAGCQPEIGDACSISTDCSANGDRWCDTTQPGGYCTEFNCTSGSCPDEAICVAFDTSVSAAPACRDPQDSARLRRTFCMRTCGAEGDCRGAYDCVNMGDPDNPWGAVVVEHGSPSGRVCAVPFTAAPVADDAGVGVCTGTDAAFLEPPPPTGPGGAGGTSGAAGAGGAGGTSGAAGAGGAGGTSGAAGAGGAGGTSGAAGAGGVGASAGVAGRG